MENSISDLLEQLQQISEDNQEGLSDWCDELCLFYENHQRHSYSEITKYITSLDGGLEYMEKVIPILEQAKVSMYLQKPDIVRNIEKLIDHIQLEIVRMQYINKFLNEAVLQNYLELALHRYCRIYRMQVHTRLFWFPAE